MIISHCGHKTCIRTQSGGFFEIKYLQDFKDLYNRAHPQRTDGRAVECTGLENRRRESVPEFESQSVRHSWGVCQSLPLILISELSVTYHSVRYLYLTSVLSFIVFSLSYFYNRCLNFMYWFRISHRLQYLMIIMETEFMDTLRTTLNGKISPITVINDEKRS